MEKPHCPPEQGAAAGRYSQRPETTHRWPDNHPVGWPDNHPVGKMALLVWLDCKGWGTRLLTDVRRQYFSPRFSADGRRLAVTAGGPVSEIWIYDLTRDAWEQLTSGGLNSSPAFRALSRW